MKGGAIFLLSTGGVYVAVLAIVAWRIAKGRRK